MNKLRYKYKPPTRYNVQTAFSIDHLLIIKVMKIEDDELTTLLTPTQTLFPSLTLALILAQSENQ